MNMLIKTDLPKKWCCKNKLCNNLNLLWFATFCATITFFMSREISFFARDVFSFHLVCVSKNQLIARHLSLHGQIQLKKCVACWQMNFLWIYWKYNEMCRVAVCKLSLRKANEYISISKNVWRIFFSYF
jgi:hypothetical protein